MITPKHRGSRVAVVDEEGFFNLSNTGAYRLLSRRDEVELATLYQQNRAKVLSLTLESLVGAQTFLDLTNSLEDSGEWSQVLFARQVLPQTLQLARHEVLLLLDQRCALHRLGRRQKLSTQLRSALAWFQQLSRAVLESLEATEAFAERVDLVALRLCETLRQLTPLTRELEQITGLAGADLPLRCRNLQPRPNLE